MGERYDCEFVDIPPKEFECAICLNVLKEPQLNDCCGQHFCRSCIQRIIDDNKPCPLCNEPNFMVILDKKTERKIFDSQVKCRLHKSGCEWVGDLRHLDQHSDSCGYVEVDCPNSCGERVQQRLVSSHKENQCSKRHIVCAYCGHTSTHEDIETKHWPVCELYPIACPNSCGVQSIQRSKIDEHLSTVCELQEVACEYSYAGCEVKLSRKDMKTHMDCDTKKHLELMTTYAKQLYESRESTEKSYSTIFERLYSTINKYNCVVYTHKMSCVRRHRQNPSRTSVFYPLYRPGYRLQLWIWETIDSQEMEVMVGVLGGYDDYRFTWPLKAIVTVEMIDEDGRLESISQSKMGIWNRPPGYNETTGVTFSPFVSKARYVMYAKRDWLLPDWDVTFKVYLCQPPES